MGCRESQIPIAWGDLWQSQEGQGNKRGSERAWGSQQKWDALSNTFNTQMQYEKALIAVGGHLCYRRGHKGERRSIKTIPYLSTFLRTPHHTFAQ